VPCFIALAVVPHPVVGGGLVAARGGQRNDFGLCRKTIPSDRSAAAHTLGAVAFSIHSAELPHRDPLNNAKGVTRIGVSKMTKKILPIIALTLALAATAAWIGFIGYQVFELAERLI
jgi:hypothetical protein